ncbi:MAG TPA: 50S ribosomal protein L24 [Catalimonadaceae bacterium]|nr:50S ribosomal protein L24 [Catalimonadaceae bacterium]
MVKLHIKKGDTVQVISGDDKGKTGVVLKIDVDKSRVLVEGLNMVTKHKKPTTGDPQSGGITKKEAGIHISNLLLVNPATGKGETTGRKENDKGKLQRYFKSNNEFVK